MSKKIKVSIIITVVFLVVMVVGVYLMKTAQTQFAETLAVQQTEMDQLKTQISVKTAEAAAKRDEVSAVVTGIDAERKLRDDDIAEEFAKRVTTWTGAEGYDAMRTQLMLDYPELDIASQFIRSFLPRRPQGTDIAASNISAEFESINTICYETVRVTDTDDFDADYDYRYFATVRCRTNGKQGGIGTVSVVFMYTINEAGEMHNISAYTLV